MLREAEVAEVEVVMRFTNSESVASNTKESKFQEEINF
jgi:hypothetical protein